MRVWVACLNFSAFKSKSMRINIQYVALTGATPTREGGGVGPQEAPNAIKPRSQRHLMFALRNGIVR